AYDMPGQARIQYCCRRNGHHSPSDAWIPRPSRGMTSPQSPDDEAPRTASSTPHITHTWTRRITMLDTQTKEQLRAYLQHLREPVEIRLDAGDDDKSREL